MDRGGVLWRPLALCQFLPGPASSQVGFSLGVLRGGGLLAVKAAWSPSPCRPLSSCLRFALGASSIKGPVAKGFLHGLKLLPLRLSPKLFGV